jgi:hypothetical protein
MWGAFGAAAPEVLRLYKQVTRTPPGTPKFSVIYLIVNGLLIFLGGAFAVARNDDTAWACLAAGVSLPMAISALASLYGGRR